MALKHRVYRTFLTALLLCALALRGTTAAQDTPAVRFSAPAVEGWMQAYFALQTGRFDKAGLHVDLDVPASAANILTSVATGDSDFGIAATTAIALAIVNGLPLIVIAPAAISTPQSQNEHLCVAKSSSIHTAQDFDGKTVGVIGLRQAGDLALRAWLRKNGGDPARIRVVQAPFSEMGVGLERGTYDAAVFTDPALTYALKSNSIRCIADTDLAIAREFMVGGWVTSKAYAQKNPDIVRRVTAVLEDTARWANAHRDETAVMVAKLTKIDVDIIRSETSRSAFGDRIKMADIQAPLDAAYAFQFLPRRMTAAEMIGK